MKESILYDDGDDDDDECVLDLSFPFLFLPCLALLSLSFGPVRDIHGGFFLQRLLMNASLITQPPFLPDRDTKIILLLTHSLT